MRSVVLLLLIVLIPATVFAATGTREDPIWPDDAIPYATISYTGVDANTYDELTAEVTVRFDGALRVNEAYEKIQEYQPYEVRGPLYFCFRFTLKANGLSPGEKLSIYAYDAFKAYNMDVIECDILTDLEQVELLDDTSAYIYVGFRTPGSLPRYIVFGDRLWFSAESSKKVDE